MEDAVSKCRHGGRLSLNRMIFRTSFIVFFMVFATLGGCKRRKEGPALQADAFVQFTSHLGNSFVAPSQWTAEDRGDTYSIRSPDGHAVIHAIMFTAQGSGSLAEFRENMVSGLLPKDALSWAPSLWTDVKLGDRDASRRDLIPIPASDRQWEIYVTSGGKFYYAIILNASKEVMMLNGAFYDSIVRSFRTVPQ